MATFYIAVVAARKGGGLNMTTQNEEGSGRQSCVGAGREVTGTGPVAVDLGRQRWCCAIEGRGGHA
jgi:hypothetical protein